LEQLSKDELVVYGVLLASLVLFLHGRIRYDGVALLALLAVTFAGIVDAEDAFLGFGHPAVITVAAVLVVSHGLMNSGVVAIISGWMERIGERPVVHLIVLTAVITVLSGFINNVGALALLMPVALRLSRAGGYQPSMLLMPLAFGSLLGGLITLIGTPPNIIVGSFRAEETGEPFRMFDFGPVGGVVAMAGVAFIVLGGWKLVPRREPGRDQEERYSIGDYLTEVRVPGESKAIGLTFAEIEREFAPDVTIVSLVRGDQRIPLPSPWDVVRAGDVLVIEANADSIDELSREFELEFEGRNGPTVGALRSQDVAVVEAVVSSGARIAGRSAYSVRMRSRFGVNLLAMSRQGSRISDRLAMVTIRPGDVLLLQGHAESLSQYLRYLGCIPLQERKLGRGERRKLALTIGLFGLAILGTAIGLVVAPVALTAAALALVLIRVLSLQEVYDSIDWPIIVLLGAMIPVGGALEVSGGTERIGQFIFDVSGDYPPAVALVVLMVGTMALSNIVNNAAAAVLMAPIGISLAQGFDASIDPFLMTVAVGASCAFLTPIGHQSNTLVMGPGGYRFGDYWRAGLPLQVIIVAVAIPMILLVWPP
jgi:di/tricarboxylate transporter